MNHSILIADDSLTIQKVIRITLSGEPYKMDDCDTSGKIFEFVESHKPSLVLLDFTIDEGVSGYDICRKIIKISPDTQVLMMYGTFDSVDEELLQGCGASGKITKPFDGQKFITMCHQILEDKTFFTSEDNQSSIESIDSHLDDIDSLENIEIPSNELVNNDIEVKNNDQGIDALDDIEWSVDDQNFELDEDSVVNHNDNTSAQTVELKEDFNFHGLLSDDLQDWGMSVPPILADQKKQEINEDAQITQEVKDKVSELAAAVDLKPVEEVQEDVNDFNFLAEASQPESTDIKVNDDGELESKNLIEFGLDNENKFSALESQLEDEVEAADDLWKIDEPESIEDKIAGKIEPEVVREVQTQAEDAIIKELKPHQENVSEQVELDSSHIEKLVRDYMNEHGKNIIEKVAWEMIPDLAENIIRQEVQEMAKKVLSKKS